MAALHRQGFLENISKAKNEDKSLFHKLVHQQRSSAKSLSNNIEYSDSIENWQDSLSLSPTNDILVAFAWAHDEEIRMVQMFPEFLGVDVTFGVNKEKRKLLLVAGIDSHKKLQLFVALCCQSNRLHIRGS